VLDDDERRQASNAASVCDRVPVSLWFTTSQFPQLLLASTQLTQREELERRPVINRASDRHVVSAVMYSRAQMIKNMPLKAEPSTNIEERDVGAADAERGKREALKDGLAAWRLVRLRRQHAIESSISKVS